MTTRAHRQPEAGYSLIELLVASAVMLVVTGAIFGLMNPAQGMSQATPEVSDLQQRMRVGTDTLFKELVMAGAGTYQGPGHWFAHQLFRAGSSATDWARQSGSPNRLSA